MTPELSAETLQRACRGDRDAFRLVVEACQKLAFNIAWRLTWNAHDAEDAAQEVFLRLYRNFDQYDPEQPFLPWFRRLATNCVLNWRERRKSFRDLPEVPFHDPPPSDPSGRLREAIRGLPEEYQVCVTLKYLEDLGIGEIAESLGVPPGTIKTWLFRAREELVRKLKPHIEAIL